MPTINELYTKIDDLKKKIEDEPRKRLKRKLEIEHEIKQLEDDKRRFGLRKEYKSVQQANTKIKKLKNKRSKDYVSKYKYQINVLKRNILDIIVDYYNNGHDIEDIFQIENVSQNIQEELLNECNFGKKTGFLFVDEINDENYNWRYYNPICEIEYKSKTFDALEDQIKSNNDIFLIFDNVLFNKCQSMDEELCQINIDRYISELKNCENISIIFKNLKEYHDKFSEKQIMDIYNFLLEDKVDYKLMIDFSHILDSNQDKLNADTITNMHYNIINVGLNRLDNPDKYDEYIYIRSSFINNIFNCLKKLSDYFGEKQIIRLCNFCIESNNYDYFQSLNYILENYEDKTFLNDIYKYIIDNVITKVNDSDYYSLRNLYKYSNYFSKSQIIKLIDSVDIFNDFRDFKFIFNKNKGKFDENELNSIYSMIIDKGIDLLHDSEYSYKQSIFSCFISLSNKFSKSQIKKLYCCILDNIGYFDNFNRILQENSDKFTQNEMEEIYCGLIDNGIEKLQNSYMTQDVISFIFDYLTYYSVYFSSKQLHKLCEIVINDICGFNKDFISLLENNDDEFEDVYEKIINQRINALKNIDSEISSSKYLMNDLRYLANKFNKTQLDDLINVILSNPNIRNFADDFIYILKSNKKENNEIYEKIIDTRITHLSNSDSGFSGIFKDLNVFAHKFNETQINMFDDIIQDEKYIYCCAEDILYILNQNRYKLGDNYQDKIIKMEINMQLNKLKNISFDYRGARGILENLEKYVDSFNESQLARLCNISNINDQVYDCYLCRSSLKYILSQNKDKIDKNLYEETFLKNNLLS